MWVILFEDEQVTNLDPITISRPAFTISCGSYRLIDLVADLGIPSCLVGASLPAGKSGA